MGIRIPAEHLSEARTLAMQKWFDKKCPARAVLFDHYITFRDALRKVAREDGTDNNAAIAKMLAASINEEESLQNYVVEVIKSPVKDAEAWYHICQSAAWIVIQTFHREIGG